jgi:hypothetical protein
MDNASRRRVLLLAALLAAAAILLGACSGSADPASGSGTPAAAGSSSGTSQSGAVAFAQCVRSHGVPDFPDPQNGHFLISSADQDNPNFNAAVQACQHLLGPGGASNGGSNNSQLLAFAHCMQTHGVPNFPDPGPSQRVSVGKQVTGNSNTPAARAYHACQQLLTRASATTPATTNSPGAAATDCLALRPPCYTRAGPD